MKRWLFSRPSATLIPVNGIVNDAGMWACTGDDPQFEVSLNNKVSLLGYYMLELTSEVPFSDSSSKLYWSNKNGHFSEDNSAQLNLGKRCTVKRVVYFSEFTRQLRWDPAEAPILLHPVNFKISKISSNFANKMMEKKLLSNGFQENEIEELSLCELYEIYGSIFSPKICNTVPYQKWIDSVEFFSGIVKSENVKFSVTMPVYNPNLEYLSLAIESVFSQTYSNWELCICDDYSSNDAVRELILEYASKDSRIKYLFREKNGNISAASNSALTMATGQYVVLLDHDDVLSPHALNEVALELESGPADIIYSDEDKISEKGGRFDPHFKSDFNFELVLSHNYISHLGVYRKSLVDKIGGFRLGYEGSQDYDLLLRCIAEIDSSNIKHIPKVLYHWRAIDGSTAQDASQKTYTGKAGLKALKSAVPLIDSTWQVKQAELPNTYTVIRPVSNHPLVSIIIPTKDQKDLLKTCIDSILSKTDYQNYEIVIVDNGSIERSTKDYFSFLFDVKNIRVLKYSKPFNFSAINNYAVSKCENSEFVLLLNNDVEVINKGWLTEMVSIAQQSDVGCVGAKLYYSNDSIQHAGVVLGIGGVAGHSHKHFLQNDNGYFSRLKLRQDLSAVTAACLLVKKSIYLQVSGLNKSDLTIAFNDVDFCLKVKGLGLRNVWTPFAQLYHYESISRGSEDTPEKVARFTKEVNYMKATWGDSLLSDPYYNMNLTLENEDFTLKAVI